MKYVLECAVSYSKIGLILRGNELCNWTKVTLNWEGKHRDQYQEGKQYQEGNASLCDTDRK